MKDDVRETEILPLLPVRDMVIFPYMIVPLFVGREISSKAVQESLSNDRMIFLTTQKEVNEQTPKPDSLYKTGVVAMVMRTRKLADGRMKVLVQGVSRARIEKFENTDSCMKVQVERFEESKAIDHTKTQPLIKTIREQIGQTMSYGKMTPPEIVTVLEDVKADPNKIADIVASNMSLKVSDAQKVLEADSAEIKLQMVCEFLNKEIEVLKMQIKIKNTAKDEINKTQKEYFLREQLRAIKSELGESDSKSEEINELRERGMKAGLSNEAKKEFFKQLHRLERMHPDASESSIVRNYLEWIVELPWSKESIDNLDLKHAREILDEDHYDITKVKERILEFLAVRKLTNKAKGPILCFVGPPGVGKTSLGNSIARAMGRKYHRIALGGVKDEAEVRGHRRTYVGAMPGKIIQALKFTKTRNPVFVLDEVDKLGNDYKGDPSSALLEVLDAEQNHTFRDHYLNLDFDLSDILFLATANVVENIPVPLRDRMEIITLSGYTEQEKFEIAKRHLITKQLDYNGLTENNIEFTDDGIQSVISNYTREAGLRNLSRELGGVCRKIAAKVVMGEDKDTFVITPDRVEELLGPAKFAKDEMNKDQKVGVATGMAWTSAGGEMLQIEAISMKGKGRITLTGQLGEVMKESAKAALGYAKANAKELGIKDEWFEKNDIHLHVPAGATPKDGPSAGITIATAIVSLITRRPIRSDITMTGEVTLTGRVLQIGGLREKALAALMYGCKNIIIPTQNAKDLVDIPADYRDKLNFMMVKSVDEVLKLALCEKPVEEVVVVDSSKDPSVTVSNA